MNTKIYFIGKYKVEGVNNYCQLSECVDYLQDKKVVGLDLETSKNLEVIGDYDEEIYRGGLDPYLSTICMLQLGTVEKVFVIDLRDFSKKELQPIVDYLHWNEITTFVGVNLKFEGKFLRHHYGIRLKNVSDCMLNELCLYNGVSNKVSLLELSIKYLGVKKKENLKLFEDKVDYDKVTLDSDLIERNSHLLTPFDLADDIQMDKSVRLQFVTIGANPFTKTQILYGSDDIVYPLLILEKQKLGHTLYTRLPYRPLANMRLESKFTQVAADMELNGMPFDVAIWTKLYEDNKIVYEERKEKLENWVKINEPDFFQTDLFNPEPRCVIEWSSPSQVVTLFRKLKICPKEKSKSTKRLEWTVGAEALKAQLPNKIKDLYDKNKWVEIVDLETLQLAYLLVRKSQMNITIFGVDFLKYVHPVTKRLHANYRTHLNTARVANTKPNLLAIPEGHRIAFTTGEGSKNDLIVRDFKSQESRVLASRSEDVSLMTFFNQGSEEFGDDFHSYTSSIIHKVRFPNSDLVVVPKEDPITGEKNPNFTEEMNAMRQKAKTTGFSIPYGTSSMSLARKLGISNEEGEDLVNNYYIAFPGVDEFLTASRKEALENGFFEMDNKLHSMFFQKDYHKMREMEEEIQGYFFTESYRELSKPDREEFKKELYLSKPYLKDNMSFIGKMRSSIQNKGCNYKIQALSAKQSKVAMVRMREYAIENNIKEWLLCVLLHDEIVSEAPESISKLVDDKVAYFMKDSAEFFCPNVKFETSGGTCKAWTH